MASEMAASFETGKTCYFLVRDRTGQIWNGSAFESYLTANYANYDVAASEQGSASGYYTGTFPPTISAGVYDVVMKNQVGGSPAESDPTVAVGSVEWGGSVRLPLADLATSGQLAQAAPIRIARGTMVQNWHVDMRLASDHISPFTSGVISGQILRNSGVWGPLESGAFTEVGHGSYVLQALTSGDLLANIASLRFTGISVSGQVADPVKQTLILQRTSGQT